MKGITKGNMHSYNDFKMRIISREINPPKKNTIKCSVPFMNGDYDFSNLYGTTSYSNRTITYLFDLFYENKLEYHSKKVQVLNWLLSSDKEKLTDDLIPGFYFMAECNGDIVFNEYTNGCEVSVTFVAYPFKISEEYEGCDLWDCFNFELDMVQDTKFVINGEKEVTIYNNSAIEIEPKVKTDSRFEIYQDGEKFIAMPGTSGGYMFKFKRGENKLILKGNGNIEFLFRREVL